MFIISGGLFSLRLLSKESKSKTGQHGEKSLSDFPGKPFSCNVEKCGQLLSLQSE